MQELQFWQERKVVMTINPGNEQLFQALHPKQIIIDRVMIPFKIMKCRCDVLTNRDNQAIHEKYVLTSKRTHSEKLAPIAITAWHEQAKTKSPHRAHKQVRYVGVENVLNPMQTGSLEITPIEGLDTGHMTFQSSIFDMASMIQQEAQNSSQVKFKTLGDILGDVHTKQVFCYDLSTGFSVAHVTFSYTRNNKARKATKTFICGKRSVYDNAYLDRQDALAMITRWADLKNKILSNVKILEFTIAPNVGALSIA